MPVEGLNLQATSTNTDRPRSSALITAAQRGLDPNVWFHNVEYVVAEKVGAEPVAYVANIYKYYIAYNLIMDARAERDRALKEFKSEDNATP
jgi:hypothetical protein